MDRIVFEVDDISASEDDFWQFLDRVGKKAEENGLTEEHLNKLLNED
ncbi:MAG: hypothetical protein JWR09_4632 [Mucilaginibacter sp.]|nr:hypothetical protein [Mucilaginibacter sp.]